MTQCMAENVEDEPAVDDFYCVFLERRVEFGDQRLIFGRIKWDKSIPGNEYRNQGIYNKYLSAPLL